MTAQFFVVVHEDDLTRAQKQIPALTGNPADDSPDFFTIKVRYLLDPLSTYWGALVWPKGNQVQGAKGLKNAFPRSICRDMPPGESLSTAIMMLGLTRLLDVLDDGLGLP